MPDEKTEEPLLEDEMLGDREEWAVWGKMNKLSLKKKMLILGISFLQYKK